MKPVKAYEAFDGTVFDTAEECADYETHSITIAQIIDKLPRFDVDSQFTIGNSYYQHDEESFRAIRDEFFAYMVERYNIPVFQNQIGNRELDTDTNWFINFFRIAKDKPSLLAWYYVGMVDKYFRQWSQSYFVNKPNEDAFMINDPTNIV